MHKYELIDIDSRQQQAADRGPQRRNVGGDNFPLPADQTGWGGGTGVAAAGDIQGRQSGALPLFRRVGSSRRVLPRAFLCNCRA